MSKTSLVCICTIAVALVGCTKNVYLEEQTPPGKVPPAASALPDDAAVQPACKCKAQTAADS